MRQELSPADKRRAWRWAACVVAGMLLVAALYLLPRSHTDAVAPPESQIVLDAAADLDDITLRATLDAENRRLSVTQTLRMRNRTGQDQSAVVLRCWANAYRTLETSPAATEELFDSCYGTAFSPGYLRLNTVKVADALTLWSYLDDAETVLSIPARWPDNEWAEVALSFEVVIPTCASRFGAWDGTFALGNVFPLPAVWQDGRWRTDGYTSIGDPFLSECANFDVTLTVPASYSVAGTAEAQTVSVVGDDVTYAMVAHAVRDFTLVAGKNLVQARRQAGDTLILAYARSMSDARRMAELAERTVEVYSARWGDYLYPTLTVAQVPFPFGGMEYPRLIMLGDSVLAAGGDTLSTTVAHEVAHQWWAIQVGSDGCHQPWQDESLCEYAVLDFIGDTRGAAARQDALFERVETSLRLSVPYGLTPGSPAEYFSDLSQYSLVVYQRGAALWVALERYLGKDALDAFLRQYQRTYRFQLATRTDFQTLLNECAGQDMTALVEDYLDTYY